MTVFSIVWALLPVFALVLLGFFLKSSSFPEDSFWPQADRLTYFVLFPALIVDKISTAQLSNPKLPPVLLILAGAILLVSVLNVLIQSLTKDNPKVFTSIIQGSIRPNTYVGLAGAVSIFGQDGLAMTAVAIAAVIPLVNIISVMAFVQYIPQGKKGTKAVLVNLLKNPLILACIIGLMLNFFSIRLTAFLYETLQMLGKAALPLGLISVGAGLKIRALGQWTALLHSSLFKLFFLPFLVFLGCWYAGIEGLPRNIVVLYAALPCSVSSYTLAAQMGGDKNLVAGIITLQTILAMASIPLVLSFL